MNGVDILANIAMLATGAFLGAMAVIVWVSMKAEEEDEEEGET